MHTFAHHVRLSITLVLLMVVLSISIQPVLSIVDISGIDQSSVSQSANLSVNAFTPESQEPLANVRDQSSTVNSGCSSGGCSRGSQSSESLAVSSDNSKASNQSLTTPRRYPLGWAKEKEHIPPGARIKPPKLLRLTTSLDWRNVGGVDWTTPIRDQAGCGSCVSFATVAPFEAALRIGTNNPNWAIDLSEQHLFACGGGICWAGMSIDGALDYLKNYGTPPESCFPYQAQMGEDLPCGSSCSNWQSQAYKIISWNWISNQAQDIQTFLQDGPLVAAMDVYEDFFNYNGGVYEHKSGTYAGGHAIAIVGYGYDSTGGYWICKNSWDTWWGENGWFKIRFGQCGIEDYVAKMSIDTHIDPVPNRLSLDFKSDLAGQAWASSTYLVATRVSQSWSSGPGGDQSTTSTIFTPTVQNLDITLTSGNKLFVMATAQLWNDNPSIGSSICISRDGTRLSGDMFASGSTGTHRGLATAVGVDSPDAGNYRYTLDFKTDPGGKAWVSGTYLVAIEISDSWSDGPTGDQSTSSISFIPSAERFSVTLNSGEKLLLIGAGQLWNDNPAIGSSVCVSRNGTIISGDIFTVGASMSHRHFGTALALDSPGSGNYEYAFSFKTDPGGRAWVSGTYLLAIKVPESWSCGPHGDQSTSSYSFTPTLESVDVIYQSGDRFLVIGTSQGWNGNSMIGSSICVSRAGSRISGDMFTLGASVYHRHPATAVAVWTAP